MESVNSFWMVVVIVFAIGAVVGAVVHRLFNVSAKNTAKLQQRLEQVEEELNTYKASVSSHFSKTSDLVSELTQDYVKVYKHLAEGAEKLGDPKKFTNVLEQQQGKVLISFADEVSAQEEGGDLVTAGETQPIGSKETGADRGDESLTAESQEHLTETIKEVAEKMKGAESPVQAADAVSAAGLSGGGQATESENQTAPAENENVKAMAADNDSKPELQLKDKPAAEIASAIQAQPEQQNSKQ